MCCGGGLFIHVIAIMALTGLQQQHNITQVPYTHLALLEGQTVIIEFDIECLFICNKYNKAAEQSLFSDGISNEDLSLEKYLKTSKHTHISM